MGKLLSDSLQEEIFHVLGEQGFDTSLQSGDEIVRRVQDKMNDLDYPHTKEGVKDVIREFGDEIVSNGSDFLESY